MLLVNIKTKGNTAYTKTSFIDFKQTNFTEMGDYLKHTFEGAMLNGH